MRTFLTLFVVAGALFAQAGRDVMEFTLFKGRGAVKIGPADVTLKGVDVNKQRYAIELVVDGHKIEKKDLDIQVPFFFYAGTALQPCELVVTKVAQDQITGRLVSPK